MPASQRGQTDPETFGVEWNTDVSPVVLEKGSRRECVYQDSLPMVDFKNGSPEKVGQRTISPKMSTRFGQSVLDLTRKSGRNRSEKL